MTLDEFASYRHHVCIDGVVPCTRMSLDRQRTSFVPTKRERIYIRLSLPISPRDSLKYFEISVPRHIIFAELRKKSNKHISKNESVI